MATPIYGSSLEETIKRLSLCFTNYDNHTNEVAICQNTYSLELLHFISLYFTALYFSCISFTHCILFLALVLQQKPLHTHTHHISQLRIEGHISGLQGYREQIAYLQLLVGSTLKYLSNCTAVIPCTWGLSHGNEKLLVSTN